MCGIAGRVSTRAFVDTVALRRAALRLRHRGPDGMGTLVREGVGLAHTRLAIIDLEGGRQPMSTQADDLHLVFNGEIYNHEVLRKELKSAGCVFRTRSDTEAVLAGYAQWGIDLPRRLRGMFALAVWDVHTRTLFLARDPVGIKPLYYAHAACGDLVFASEMSALFAWPDIPADVDDQALELFLALRYVPGPRAALRSVRKLEPGHTLTWCSGGVSIQPYWDLPLAKEPESGETLVEEAARLRSIIDQSVQAHLISDVPVGVFLSGGVDSSVVTASMVRAAGTKVRSFAIGFDDHSSELDWARMAARALGTEHHELVLGAGEVESELSRIVHHLDEPVADTAAVPLYFLARAARQSVTVVLSGEGGDEAFAGYVAYQRQLWAEPVRRFLHATRFPAIANSPLWTGRMGRILRMLAQRLERSYLGVGRGLGQFEDRAASVLAQHWKRSTGLSALRRMMYLDLKAWLPDDLLVKADKMTMAHGLELRVPLLDRDLLEWAWRRPDAHVACKRLLKLSARGRVPERILDRKKSGFGNPLSSWLRGPLYDLANDALLDPHALCPLGPKLTRALLAQHRLTGTRGVEVWTLLVLELWLREAGRWFHEPMPLAHEATA